MRIVRRVSFGFTALCLLVAVVAMLVPWKYTMTVGWSPSTTVDCGSAAFPKQSIDFVPSIDFSSNMDLSPVMEKAANCAGLPSAAPALLFVVLAGVGFCLFAFTSRDPSTKRREEQPAAQEPGSF